MKNNEYQALQSALQLPSHEEALLVFETISDLNLRSSAGKVNILHHFISTYGYSSGKHLRIKDFYVLVRTSFLNGNIIFHLKINLTYLRRDKLPEI